MKPLKSLACDWPTFPFPGLYLRKDKVTSYLKEKRTSEQQKNKLANMKHLLLNGKNLPF